MTETDPGLQDALAALWLRARERVDGRIDVLEDATAAVAEGRLAGDLRVRARTAAHQLAGLLGTLGLPAASPVARRLERLLTDGPVPGDALAMRDDVRALRDAAEAGPTA